MDDVISEGLLITPLDCEILDVVKAGQLVDQTEQSPKSAFLTARKEQIYARAADRQIGSRVCGSA